MEGWELDKDILCSECKVYSPETCCFVPTRINKFFCSPKQSKFGLNVGVKRNGKSFQYAIYIDGERLRSKNYKTQEEASFFYKKEKENYARRVAEEWKDLIDPKIYQALINYKVKITD